MSVSARVLLRSPLGVIGCGFGAGLSPVAPGTVGTLVAVVPYLWLQHLSPSAYIAVVLLAAALGVWAGNVVIKRLGQEDPSAFVWDEFVGFWITMAFAPPGWIWILAGFAAFRFFDVLKPWPVSFADRKLKGGFGAMLDDVLAGLYALGLMQVLRYFFG